MCSRRWLRPTFDTMKSFTQIDLLHWKVRMTRFARLLQILRFKFILVIHFMPLVYFYTPRKHWKTSSFPMSLGRNGKRTVTWNGLINCKNVWSTVCKFVGGGGNPRPCLLWNVKLVLFHKSVLHQKMEGTFIKSFCTSTVWKHYEC